jgi:hypothetical protein
VSAVDVALMSKLQGAAAVTSAAPGGVYQDVAPHGIAEPFVIVTLQAHTDVYENSNSPLPAFEIGRYLVKAVGQGAQSAAVASAAAAIHAALQDATLTITGYSQMVCHREERIRYVEVDGAVRWQHRGGIYAVWASA